MVFTSSSSVHAFVQSFPRLDFSLVHAVCIGAKTTKTAKEYGMHTETSEKATIESILEKVIEKAEREKR